MILQFKDLEGKVGKVKANITTEHSASSYGQPVVVLEDGNAIDAFSWIILKYKIIKANEEEQSLMENWMKNIVL